MDNFWSSCLRRLEQELPPQQFNTWIRPLRIEDKSGITGELCLLAPNNFILNRVRECYFSRIEEIAGAYFSPPVSLSLSVGKAPAETTASFQSFSKNSSSAALAPLGASNPGDFFPSEPPPTVNPHYQKTHLEPGFTFENLIVGKANDFARAAAIQVASNAGASAYNPLFIYGSTGLGKTHMIHAIGNRIFQKNRKSVVRYVHAGNYYSDLVRAYQANSFDAFKHYYRSLDVLLLDDIQFFNGKTRTQEEFFFVFNALIESKKQIVISCDTYPKDISGLENRLITRFDQGLTVQIEPPELEMRVAILKKKAEIESIDLDDESAFYIAKHKRSNVRELEGALKIVYAHSSYLGRKIDLDLSKEALKNSIDAVNRQITIDNIQKTVADYFKIKVGDLFSRKRNRQIVRPRQIAMWLAKNLTSSSYPMIGEAFGGRDHTTVLHAIRTIESLRAKEEKLNHDVHVLTQVLKG
ncbi:MAG: chromosomal replication initiator protein DnaA [Candidatus Accumulibacter sp.]|jgi:chromosomal replication initiator protein|nr:chromosomal replication initiator protein DnaA [Accumulibacter sp.]